MDSRWGSIKVTNDAGKIMDDAEIEHSDTEFAIATGHDLEYKEQMLSTYSTLEEHDSAECFLIFDDLLRSLRNLRFLSVIVSAPYIVFCFFIYKFRMRLQTYFAPGKGLVRGDKIRPL